MVHVSKYTIHGSYGMYTPLIIYGLTIPLTNHLEALVSGAKEGAKGQSSSRVPVFPEGKIVLSRGAMS